MKKFLTMLLALSVVFTFTFGSTVGVFAAEAKTYTADEFNTVLTTAENTQLSYLGNAKTQAVAGYTYDDDGYTTIKISGVDYKISKKAVEAAADAVIASIDKLMKTEITTQLEAITEFPTTTAPNTVSVAAKTTYATSDCLTKAGMQKALEAEVNTEAKSVLLVTEEPLTKAFVEGEMAVDTTKYNSTTKTYKADGSAGTDLTAAEYVALLAKNAKEEVAKTAKDKTKTEGQKILAYRDALTTFTGKYEAVKTLAQEDAEAAQVEKDVDAAAKKFVATGLEQKYYNVAAVPTAPATVSLETAVAGDYAAVYVDNAAPAKDTVFGVEVADIKKVTADEMTAINAAAYKAVNDAEAILVKGLKAGNSTTIAAYNTKSAYIGVLAKTMGAADKYAEVVKEGNTLKATYEAGVKRYDDAKVDAAVKAAEALVYKDAVVTGSFTKTAAQYITAAAAAEKIDMNATTSERARIAKAKADAIGKFIDTAVPYGENKTAEADLVYVKGTYATSAGTAYDKIKTNTIKAINNAESVADVATALEDAKVELAKLLLAANADAVGKAIDAAKKDFAGYVTYKKGLADITKYNYGQFDAAKTAGDKLIEAAITVDAVNAAVAEAKALADGVKTDAEIDAVAKTVTDQINALPLSANITAADYANIKAVVDAVVDYNEICGSSKPAIFTALLKSKLNTAIDATAKDTEAKATALDKNLALVATGSDADLAAYVAYKDEAAAIAKAYNELKDAVDAINEDITSFATISATTTKSAAITALVEGKTDAKTFYKKEIALCSALVAKAYKSDATKEDMEAAIAAYEKLTDLQKTVYETSDQGYNMVGIIKDKLAELTKYTDKDAKADLLDMARKVTIWRTSKTSIKVTAVGSVKNIKDNGYTVKYTFYKKAPGAKAYKAIKTTTSNKYTYTNLKKGTNKFQVKVKVYDAEGKLVASKMTYYRAAKVK